MTERFRAEREVKGEARSEGVLRRKGTSAARGCVWKVLVRASCWMTLWRSLQ